MRRMLTAILGFALSLAVAGCSYKGALEVQSYVANPDAAGGAKLPATVALVDDGQLDKFQLSGGIGTSGFTLLVGPAIKRAYLKELEASFATVSTVARSSDDAKVDFFAFPVFAWVPLDRNVFTAVARLKIVERQSHRSAQYQEVARASFEPTATTEAAAFATAVTLGALAPIAEPIKRDAVGTVVQKRAREAIDTVMHKLGDDLRHDRGLEIAATLGPIREAAAEPAPRRAEDAPYEKFLDAVVVVRVATGIGSGFFVAPDGLLVTCAHVVSGSDTVTVKDRRGREFPGQVVKIDRERDLALVRAVGASSVPTVALAPDPAQAVGHDVIAIGTPEGLSWSLSKGVASAIRSLRTARVVQTDAATLPGSSGGPLIDPKAGRVVGIASFTQGPGVSFAIAADEVNKAFPSELR